MTVRHLIWSNPNGPALEHLTLRGDSGGWLADGVQIGRQGDGAPFRLHYRIRLTENWQMSAVTVSLTASDANDPFELALSVDGSAEWRDAKGEVMPGLKGCHEVDIPESPFSCTLPIRRLDLTSGESAEISVASVTLPTLDVRPVRQTYSCVRPIGPDGGEFRHEPMIRGEAHDLSVDSDGLVIDYPGEFRRAWAG